MILSVKDLSKIYRGGDSAVSVLRGVSFDLAEGESVALTGESGSGKSTLLHLVGGLDQADGGEIWIQGVRIDAMSDSQLAGMRRSTVSLIFQQFNLIPSLSVVDNLSFQAKIADRFDHVWQEELVARLGLGDLLARYPEQLSGGSSSELRSGVRLRGGLRWFWRMSQPETSTKQQRIRSCD